MLNVSPAYPHNHYRHTLSRVFPPPQIIEKESVEVAATSENVRKEEASANEQAATAQALKDECESELAEAIPALEAALSALNTLKV